MHHYFLSDFIRITDLFLLVLSSPSHACHTFGTLYGLIHFDFALVAGVQRQLVHV